MSILIDELEARKNDYILVADVINTMANATNSAPGEVVKYLDAHNIDEKLAILYMDESYHFEPYNGYFLSLGNDANITYFQKSDVMAFEPITKHGIFENNLVNKKTPNDDKGTCFASYLNAFNLAQLTALIMGIDIGDIGVNESRAYLREHNDYPDGFYDKYLSNLESIKTMALANDQNLFNVTMFEESDFAGNKKEKISLTETTISKINLIALCEEMGKSFDEMLRRQTPIVLPIHQQAATDDLLPNQPDNQLQAENEQLKRRIAELEQQLKNPQSSLSKTNNINLDIKNEQVINSLKDDLEKLTTENNTLEQQTSKQVTMPADDVQLNGIAKYNANKAYVIATGQALASYLWSMDTTKAIRTGDMVQQVRHVIHSVAPDLLPDDKAIRGWLSDIAPDYAKKGGKTPKDAPSEISLTMKK